MILLINGAFGIGKTSLARELSRRIPRSGIYDPELLGLVLQRALRLFGRNVGDFQDLRLWRRLTPLGIRLARLRFQTVIVPIGISDPVVLRDIMSAAGQFDPDTRHFCLTAPIEVVHGRLAGRGASRDANAWEYRRAIECCAAHAGPEFSLHLDASAKSVDGLASHVMSTLQATLSRPSAEP